MSPWLIGSLAFNALLLAMCAAMMKRYFDSLKWNREDRQGFENEKQWEADARVTLVRELASLKGAMAECLRNVAVEMDRNYPYACDEREALSGLQYAIEQQAKEPGAAIWLDPWVTHKLETLLGSKFGEKNEPVWLGDVMSMAGQLHERAMSTAIELMRLPSMSGTYVAALTEWGCFLDKALAQYIRLVGDGDEARRKLQMVVDVWRGNDLSGGIWHAERVH